MKLRVALALIALVAPVGASSTQDREQYRPDVSGREAAVVADHPLAAAAGQDVLRRGTLLRCRFEEGGVQASACPLYLGDDFRPRPTGPCRPVDDVPVEGLAEEAYRDRIRETIHAQRVAAYRYAARHLTRYPVRVGLELAATTAANKLSGLLPRRHG